MKNDLNYMPANPTLEIFAVKHIMGATKKSTHMYARWN